MLNSVRKQNVAHDTWHKAKKERCVTSSMRDNLLMVTLKTIVPKRVQEAKAADDEEENLVLVRSLQDIIQSPGLFWSLI